MTTAEYRLMNGHQRALCDAYSSVLRDLRERREKVDIAIAILEAANVDRQKEPAHA